MQGATALLTWPQPKAAFDVIGPATIMQAKTKHASFMTPAISLFVFRVCVWFAKRDVRNDLSDEEC